MGKFNLSFIKGLFSESDGTPSITLILMTLIVTFTLGFGLAFGIQTHSHLITMDQFVAYLGAAGAFIATSCGPLFLVHKGADVLIHKRDDKDKDGGQ